MKTYKQQLGVGLMEVLVTLLILAIGVLGFIALQYRALEAMGEGENRIQAINIARDLAEKMRVNRSVLPVYAQTLATPVSILPRPNCFQSLCTPTQKAVFDAAFIKLSAQRIGMSINMFDCPEVNNGRQCAYIAWNDTAATMGDSPEDCTTNTGSYQPTSTCIVMEVY
jgi:type IV pilus assembly protein PilV